MKTVEFIEYMGNKINGTMKEEQILKLVQEQLEVKKYISIKEKKDLVDKIIYHSAYFEDGILKINSIDCYMYFIIWTIDAYTNLEIDNVEDCYDVLSQSGLMPVIIVALGQEYRDVQTFLNMKRSELLEDNSIEAQVGKFLNNVSGEIDDLKEVLIDMLNGFDINKGDIMKLIQMFVQQQ